MDWKKLLKSVGIGAGLGLLTYFICGNSAVATGVFVLVAYMEAR